VEIRDHVGPENIFIFGLTAEEVEARRRDGYNPREAIEASTDLHSALDSLASGIFSPDDPNRYRPIVDSLYDGDWFMVAADFDAYASAQRQAAELWRKPKEWTAKTILNTANMGWFSSDRTIREYARDIWTVPVT
jgi:starch phosphorylase